MTAILLLTQIGVSAATFATILYTLFRMIAVTAEAREARAAAARVAAETRTAATEAARAAAGAASSAHEAVLRAEGASVLAVSHARETTAIMQTVGSTIAELKTQTDGLKDALVASVAKASDLEGEKRGREQEVVRAAEAVKL